MKIRLILALLIIFAVYGIQTSNTTFAAYRDTIQATANLLNYWPLDNNAGATSTALVGGVNMFLSSTTSSTAGQVDGTAVSFNGTSSFGSTTASIDLSPYNKVVVEGIINLNAPVDADSVVWELSTNINTVTTGFNYSANVAGVPNTSVALMKGNGSYNYDFFNRPSASTWHHIVTVFDKGQAIRETAVYLDGALMTATSTGGYADNTNNFGNLPFFIMSRGGGSANFLGGKLQHVAIYSDLSPARILAHALAAGLASTTYTVQASDLWDNGYNNTTNNPRQSNYARFVFTTDAPNITITGTNTIYSSYPTYAHLGLRINSVDQSPLAFTANGTQNFNVSLGSPGTTKTVEVISGLESKPSTVLGSFVDSVTYPGTSTLSVSAPTAQPSRVVFYGDSITVGGNAVNSETTSFVPLLRNTYNLSAMLEGWGYRSLYDDASSTRTAIVNRIASYSPAVLWIPIGSNDYGLNKWSAVNYGTAYSAFLDDIHTASPSTRIVCQTPLVRNSEAANSFSDTLSNYRTQVRNACANRSYAIVVEDSTLIGLSDLDPDGVHLTTAGHAKYAVGVNNVFTVKPTVTASSTSGVSTTGITLNASISAVGSTTPTDKGFHYGTTSSYGSIASSTGTFSMGAFSQTLSNLTCGTTYHYRAFATNFAGTASTSDATFTTDTCPVSASNASVSTSGGSRVSAEVLAQIFGNSFVFGGDSPSSPFIRNLSSGMSGSDIKNLQRYLNTKGYAITSSGPGSAGNETNYFGGLTRAALARFQKAHSISPALGFFGPITKAFINSHP